MKTTLIQFIALFLLELIILYPISFVQALSITNVNVTDLGSSSAEIKWSTDEVADGTVRYGLDSNLGSSSSHSTFIFEHTAQLQSLASDKTYFFEVESANINGDTVVDSNNGQLYSFTTNDIIPPDKVVGLQVSRTTKNSITLAWQSSNASDLSRYNIYRNRIKIATSTEATHTDSGLVPGSSHVYKVTAVDTSGNEGPESNTVLAFARDVDLSSKVITNIDLENIQDTSLTITWDTIDDSTSIVYYGLDQSLNNKEEVSTLTKNHSVTLRNLQTGSFYSFIVSSCDANNNCVNSSLSGFDAGRDINAPKINVSMPKFINKRQIDIIGTTEPFSSIKLFVNDLNFPIRALDRTETPTGKFQFLNIQLQKENVIKIEAIDKSNNKVEETFRVSVDTEDPVVVIDQIPSITSSNNLTIVGIVDEPVDINFFLKLGTLSKPNKVAGLKAAAGNNSVALEWNESKDEEFSHYVVYREDIGPIAITNPSSYTTFTDLLVNKNEQLAYFITAVNKFGKESEKSASVTVTVRDGTTGIPPPEPIDTIFVEKPVLSINASGSFSESLKLSRDGSYTLTIEVIDRAKNRVVIEKTILLDTKKPDIKITSPPNNQLIFENYANEIDITGETEPNARVHLFIERTPLGFLEKSGDVAGLPNKIEHISETELDAKCRLELGGQQFCSTAADFSTTADSNGNFKFENVDATSILSGGIRVAQVSGVDLREERRFEEEKASRLVFIATDQAGLRNAKEHKLRIGTCWSGNQSWDLIPLTEFQSPTLISPQRLAENKETIYFFFNYSYIGRGTDARINTPNGVSISRACDGTEVLGDKRFNISCMIMPGGGFGTAVNPEGTVTYTAIKLNRIEGMDRFLENDWKDFFKSVSNELTFPFKFRIRYTHLVNGQEVEEVQTTCQEVTYVLDNSIIDPRRVLPDWLLYDFVDFLQESISTIGKINQQIDKVLDFVVVGCVSSFLLRLAFQIHRRFISFSEEKIFQIKDISNRIIPGSNFIRFNNVETEDDQKYCNQISEKIRDKHDIEKSKDKGINQLLGLKLSYFSDKDLRRCFPSVADAWEREANLYTYYRFACDRVFGHETPSAWTENLRDHQIYDKIQEGGQCSVDQSTKGQTLHAVKCRELADTFERAGEINPGKECFVIRKGNTISLYELGSLIDKDVYQLEKVQGPAEKDTIYALKQTERSYLTNRPETCEEACTGSTNKGRNVAVIDGQKVILGDNPKSQDDKQKIVSICAKANQCSAWAEKEQKVSFGDIIVNVKSARREGYTDGCFFLDNDPTTISNDANARFECCCLNTDNTPPATYYVFDDLNLYKNPDETRDFAFASKESTEQELQVPSEFADMEWSYRYWKERYQTTCNPENEYYKESCPEEDIKIHSQYNPNRYIEGRDFPACFGQNNWIYDGFTEEEGNLVMIDSRQQHTSAFQCLNIAGIQNRLILLNNIQGALASCLIDIRETGTSDAAACKEFFTRYVCSSIWEVISWFTSACSPFSVGSVLPDEDDYFGVVRDGFRSVTDSITDAQSELAAEYGNAELNNLLGTGLGEVARKVCLGAFGYDWDLSLQNVIDAAYSQSFETLVQKTTGTREYLTIDPLKSYAKYDYRASWIINPGCDIENYRVDLACVSRNEIYGGGSSFDPFSEIGIPSRGIRCDAVGSPDGNNCDCLDLDQEQTTSFFSSRRGLNQNQFVQEAHDEVISSPYRYDHLKFTLRPDRELRGGLQRTCFPPGHEDGVFYFPLSDKTARDIQACKVEPLSGLFTCQGSLDFWSKKGTASFLSLKVNDETPRNNKVSMFKGDPLTVTPTIFKSPSSPLKCLEIKVDKRGRGQPVTKVQQINVDGPFTYGPYPIISEVQTLRSSEAGFILEALSCGESDPTREECNRIIENKDLSINIIEHNNEFDVTRNIKFVDDLNNPNGVIDVSSTSKDEMILNGIRKIIGEGGWWNNGLIVQLNDERSVLEITEVPFDSRLKEIEYKVSIPGKSIDEHWKLILTLYEADELSTDCSRFNLGELSQFDQTDQKREIDLLVKASEFDVDLPQINFNFGKDSNGNDVYYLNPQTGSVLDLNIEITDEKGLQSAEYFIVSPDTREQPLDIEDSRCKANGQNKLVCPLKINAQFLEKHLGSNYTAGPYQIRALAINNIQNQRQEEVEITVRCGKADGLNVGFCSNQCETSEIDTSGGVSCQLGLQCCLVSQISTPTFQYR